MSLYFGNTEVKAASGSLNFSGGIIEEDSTSSESAIQTVDVAVPAPASSTSVSTGNNSTGFSGGMSLSGGTIEEEVIIPSSKEETPKDDAKPSPDSSKEDAPKDDAKPSPDSSKEEAPKDDAKPSPDSSKEETPKDDAKPSQDTSKEETTTKTEEVSNDASTVESSNETETPSVSPEEQTQVQAENPPVAVASNDSTTVAPNSMNKSARKSAVSGEAMSNSSLLKLLPPMSGDYGLVPSAEAEDKTEFPAALVGLLSLLVLLLVGLLSMRYKVVDADDNTDHFMTLKKAVCNANGNEGYKVFDNFHKPSEKCVLEVKDGQGVVPEYVSDNNRKRIMEYVQN